MRDQLKRMAWNALGMALAIVALVALYVPGRWLVDRYTEFTIMRTVVVLIACGNPAEAAKLRIVCPAPVAAPTNSSPPAVVPKGTP